MKLQRTLIVLKPDAVQRGIVGDIINRFEKIGLKIVAAKMFIPSKKLLNKHYPVERKEFITGLGSKTLENYKEQGINPLDDFGNEDPYKIGLVVQKWLVDFMTSAPVFAMVLEGPHAIEIVRKVRGHTLPLKAAPGTITGDYSFDSSAAANSALRPIRNLVHASGNAEEAEYEIGLWFKENELFDYETIHLKNML
ncbi:nucleoside-diphosphate kinase [Candidatus Saccharibacteria bacterium]|jgi:nucleoside-diphosphate kinase|nr:nucleoside-diphosphate kinase [Candidatus Saccharibacteria bacterium]HOR23403.1 nucleoside-diphosphate kinase [Candidatus Saccharibacteria bacterium]